MNNSEDFVTLQPDQQWFETVYAPSPLVIVGTKEPDGSDDLAPKHIAFPLGWSDYFGFVCTPEHSTYRNAERTGVFTVSYPRPENVLDATLAAAPRDEEGDKPSLEGIDTFEGDSVGAPVVEDSYAVLECELDRTVDGFGRGSLIAGEVVAKHVHREAYRSYDDEPEEVFRRAPSLVYFYPDRFAEVENTQAFPFPQGFSR